MKRDRWLAAGVGALFALGLGVSGMTDPGNILGFLDVTGGAWNPALAFVMAGALLVHAPLVRIARQRSRPWRTGRFANPGSAPRRGFPRVTGVRPSSGISKGHSTPVQGVRRVIAWPQDSGITARLVGGAAIFGVGWGLSGYCPGPAIVGVAALHPNTLVFAATLAMGAMIGRAFSGGSKQSLHTRCEHPFTRGADEDPTIV